METQILGTYDDTDIRGVYVFESSVPTERWPSGRNANQTNGFQARTVQVRATPAPNPLEYERLKNRLP